MKKYSKIFVLKKTNSTYPTAGIQTVLIKQIITTTFVKGFEKISNSLSKNVFLADEFNLEPYSADKEEIRCCLLTAPDHLSIEEIENRINQQENPVIYKILSNYPILTDEEQYLFDKHSTSKEIIANKQAIRYSKTEKNNGNLALDEHGKIQYRRLFFNAEMKEDQDRRTPIYSDQYLSSELKAELNNKVHIAKNQKI